MEKKNFKLEINGSVVNFNIATAKGKEEKKEWFDELVPEFSKNAESAWDVRKKEPICVLKKEHAITGDLEFDICIDTELVNIDKESEESSRDIVFFKLSADLAITTLLHYLVGEDKEIKLSELHTKSIGNTTVGDNITVIQINIFQNLLNL